MTPLPNKTPRNTSIATCGAAVFVPNSSVSSTLKAKAPPDPTIPIYLPPVKNNANRSQPFTHAVQCETGFQKLPAVRRSTTTISKRKEQQEQLEQEMEEEKEAEKEAERIKQIQNDVPMCTFGSGIYHPAIL